MMQAFHNSNTVKEKYLNRIISHRKADEIVQGTYWKNGKGCAVGCTIHSDEHVHRAFEYELGIPEWVAELEDQMFENMSNKDAKAFPEKFLSAIPVGFANWDKVWNELSIYIINTFANTQYLEIKSRVDWILKLHMNPETDGTQWTDAKHEMHSIIGNLLKIQRVRFSSSGMNNHMVARWNDIVCTAKILYNTTMQMNVFDAITYNIAHNMTSPGDVETIQSNRAKVTGKCATKLLEILENQK